MRCVIFSAVSTAAQVGDEANPKESIPAQIADARRFIEGRDGWREVCEPLVVDGQSRAIDWLDQAVKEIPSLARLLELADGGLVDLVVVRDFDRLARTQFLLDQIRMRLREDAVQVYSLNQPAEPLPAEEAHGQSDGAFLMEAFGGILAEWENRMRVRRTRMGIRGRVKQGYHPNNIPPFGYRLDDGEMAIVPAEAAVVRTMFELYLSGWGSHSIARELEKRGHRTRLGSRWFASTVRYCLMNPMYAGYVAYSRRPTVRTREGHSRATKPGPDFLLAEGRHEAIVSRDMWETAERERERRLTTFRPRRQDRTYPLSGLLRCDYCGASMCIVGSSTWERTYYGCGWHRRTGECRTNSVLLVEIDAQVHALADSLMDSAAVRVALMEEGLSAELGQLRETKEALTGQSTKVRQALSRWTRDYEDGFLEREEFYGQRAETRERLENLLERIDELTEEIESKEGLLASHERLDQALSASARLSTMTAEEQRRTLHAVFASIDVRDRRIVSWRFV